MRRFDIKTIRMKMTRLRAFVGLFKGNKFGYSYWPKCRQNSFLYPVPMIPSRFVSSTAYSGNLEDIIQLPQNVVNHDDLHKFSTEKLDEFWGPLGREYITWTTPFDKIHDCDMVKGSFSWFTGGELNASVNCVDRHMKNNPNKIALIWEKDEPGQEVKITYHQLYDMTNRIANVLKSHGVRKGDVVALYMPISPLAVASMLACSRIGAIHSVIFAGFSAEAVSSRIRDANAVAVITSDESVRGGKIVPLKATIDSALQNCTTVRNVFVMRRTGNEKVNMGPRDSYLEDAMSQVDPYCVPEIMKAEDYLFILYTSGSTGKPKGLAHSTAGYLLYAAFTHKTVFDYKAGDIFGCVADIGWITGHSYVVYGPLMNGGTSVLFESTPTYPDPGRYWEMVERLKINQFYGAPTAIRLLLRHDQSYVKNYDRSSLRTLGSVGEPINKDAWEWFNNVVGDSKCDLVDTWWQTETGGICITPRPSEIGAEIIAGKPMRPMFGINPVLLNEKGQELSGNNIYGALCMKTPWPGMARTVYGDHKRFQETYFSAYPGYYFTGDGGHRDANGYWQITGRMDDVINVTGHRLGTAEVEDVLTKHENVAEAAVVGYPHSIKGEGVYAYLILKNTNDEKYQGKIDNELRDLVKKQISGFAIPDKIQFCSGLPKTRSGKIMRRILRKVAANDFNNLGDISTLAEPSIVSEIIENHKKL